MADADSPDPSPAPLSARNENLIPIGSTITELNERKLELVNRVQSLKQDLQNWKSNLDTQINTSSSELSELKKSLNVEVEQLRTEFQELRTTLQQQQKDVTTNLRTLGLQDVPVDDDQTQGQHPVAESSDKEDKDEAKKNEGNEA